MVIYFLYFILLCAIVPAFRRILRFRGESTIERFAATRQLSWLTLGASMAAAQISADTPILVVGAVYADGLAGNWFWWISAPGVLATLLFFAPLWRRSGVLTDAEIIKLRYGDGGLARGFRVIKAIGDGVILNSLVIASNLYAFTLVLEVVFRKQGGVIDMNLVGAVSAAILILAVVLACLGGFRGVVRLNSIGFVLAIACAAVLAVLAVSGLPHGLATLQGLTTSHTHARPLSVLPPEGPIGVMVLLGLGWWHSAPGHTMLVQRMVASRNEREARLTVVSYSILHYLVRPWGWYLIGAASLYYWPQLREAEWALPKAANKLLPSSFFGLLAVSVALSLLGTVNSRLNLGAAYLVNDVTKVFSPLLTPKRTRFVEISTTITLALMAYVIASTHLVSSIRGLYQFMIMMMSGTGFVSIARWYWSETTVRSEVASYASSIVVAGLTLGVADTQSLSAFTAMSGVNFLIGGAVTIAVAKLWPDNHSEASKAFYCRIQPPGIGWRRYSTEPSEGLGRTAIQWALSNIVLFSTMFAIASLISGRIADSAALVGVAITICGVLARLPSAKMVLK